MSLSSFNIRKQVQIASLYSAYKSYLHIEGEVKGNKPTPDDTKRLRVFNALVNSINRYGKIYIQPTFTFSIDTARSNSTVSLLFGDVSYSIPFQSNNTSLAAKEVSDYINTANTGFTSVANVNYITVSAVNGSLSNELEATISVNNGSVLGIPFPTEFSDDGSDYFSENTDRVVTDIQIYGIIDKINSMIDEPYNNFLTF